MVEQDNHNSIFFMPKEVMLKVEWITNNLLSKMIVSDQLYHFNYLWHTKKYSTHCSTHVLLLWKVQKIASLNNISAQLFSAQENYLFCLVEQVRAGQVNGSSGRSKTSGGSGWPLWGTTCGPVTVQWWWSYQNKHYGFVSYGAAGGCRHDSKFEDQVSFRVFGPHHYGHHPDNC